MAFLRASNVFAALKSSSAYLVHDLSSVTSVIKNFPLFDNFPYEETMIYSTLHCVFNFLRRFDKNIGRKLTRIQQHGNSTMYFFVFAICFHDDKQIHITIRCGVPGCVRSEQDNFLWFETCHDPLDCLRQRLRHRRETSRADIGFDLQRHGFILQQILSVTRQKFGIFGQR